MKIKDKVQGYRLTDWEKVKQKEMVIRQAILKCYGDGEDGISWDSDDVGFMQGESANYFNCNDYAAMIQAMHSVYIHETGDRTCEIKDFCVTLSAAIMQIAIQDEQQKNIYG